MTEAESSTNRPTSRRAVLAGAIAAVGGLAAQALARPGLVAAQGEAVLVGGIYADATQPTYIANTVNGNPVIEGASYGSGVGVFGVSSTGHGVEGSSSSAEGVYGSSTFGDGVSGLSLHASGVNGTSSYGAGVQGHSAAITGVYGLTDGSGQAGVLGKSQVNGIGVYGYSGGKEGPAVPPAKTGVLGVASQDAGSRGVFGRSNAGHGVHGEATSGLGVRGYATSGVGLSGEATTGYALRTKGRVTFDRSVGLATIASGQKSVTVTPGIDLTATTAVVATLQGSAGGTTTVHRVAVNTTANTFTIDLTANSTASVKVAWHLFG